MMEASTRLVMARRIPIRIWLLRLGVLPPARLIRWVSGIHGRVTFQISSSSVPELRTTLEIGQKRRRSAFIFFISASLASVVTSIRRRIFGNGTSISSSNCVPRRSKVDSALIVMALSSTPCFFAHLWLMTLVQAISAATIVSVGVGPMLVPSRSLGSSMTVLTPHGNFGARMGRTVSVNTLRDGGLLFYGNHDVAPVVSLGVIEIRDGSRLR